jgi:hypothetical protein
MKNWLEASWIAVTFRDVSGSGEEGISSLGGGAWDFIYTDMESLAEAMDSFTDYCNVNQFEIKTIVPIDRAVTHDYSQHDIGASYGVNGQAGDGWGLGYGWAYSKISGFTALLQKSENIDDEEYENRLKNLKIARNIRSKKRLLEKELKELKQSVPEKTEELRPFEGVMDEHVQEKKEKMFSKKYTFRHTTFENKQDAEDYRFSLVTKYEQISREVSRLQGIINEKEQQLKKVHEESKSLLYWKP